MLSSKMLTLTKNNSVIRAMFEEGARLSKLHGPENVFDFSLGNPNFPPPEAVKTALMQVLSQETPAAIHGYMPNAGFPAVRQAVADFLNETQGTRLTFENIIMSVGAAGGLNAALKTLLNPGDEVVAFAPYFVEYGNYVGNFDGILKVAKPRIPDFLPRAEDLYALVNEKTKAVILNTPNNPTGVVYSEDTIARLADVLETKQKKYGAPIYLIADEPYRELAYDNVDVPYITKLYRNTLVCYSWSKSLSLPGERIGYVVIPSEADDFATATQACAIATRVLGFVNAPSLMQLAVARCLREKTDIASYDANRKQLYEGLTRLGYSCVYPQGAFYLWMEAPNGDDLRFAEAAKAQNILLVPGRSFACPGYVRIAYCVNPAVIERSLPGFAAIAPRTLGARSKT